MRRGVLQGSRIIPFTIRQNCDKTRHNPDKVRHFPPFSATTAVKALPQRTQRTERKAIRKRAGMADKIRQNPDKIRHFPPFCATVADAKFAELADKVMTKSAIIPTKSAIFRHVIPRHSLTSSEAERVLCAFYARKENFFAHKRFRFCAASLPRRMFIPRLRVGRATRWPRF